MATDEDKKFLMPFEIFGVEFTGNIGNQEIGTCIFCGKEKHFYVNRNNGKWDCKKCGKAGGVQQFLKDIHECCLELTTNDTLAPLSERRCLPIRILKHFNIVSWYENAWLVPVYDFDGELVDLLRYELNDRKQKLKPCPTRQTEIFNLKDLKDPAKLGQPVYIFEGPWDAIGWYWILEKTKTAGVAVAVPGARTFKHQWVGYFTDREVIVCDDNDSAGDDGQLKKKKFIGAVSRSIHYVNWPRELKSGYDISDFIYDHAICTKDFSLCVQKLKAFIAREPRTELEHTPIAGDSEQVSIDPKLIPQDLAELLSYYRDILEINDEFEIFIKVLLAVIISINHPDPTNPLWMFFIGPPSSGKTTLLMSILKSTHCHFESNLSSTALISGWQKPNQPDPSLVPRLNGRCLVLKDYTEILGRPETEKNEIISVLRGAFDGEASRSYGQGVQRKYRSRFTVAAGVTKAIYSQSDAAMGERFLRFSLRTHGVDPDKQQEAALNAAIFGATKIELLREKVAYYLNRNWKEFFNPDDLQNRIPPWFRPKLKALARVVTHLRTLVERHHSYERLSGEPVYTPEKEMPQRMTVQLEKLALSLAIIMGKPQIDDEIYLIVKRVAIDTIYSYGYLIVKCLFKFQKPLHIEKFMEYVPLSKSGIRMYLEDLVLTELVKKDLDSAGKPIFSISSSVSNEWRAAGL